ncbi:MAG TPA: response regulator transcription factor [Gaiellaceae bacterium]|nr:response regulator transcription factor [Gaiellaceae bacterium]
MAGATPIRVLVADDDRLFRESVLALFWKEERIEVVGYASNGEEAVERAGALRPDVVTMDLQMPVMGGLEATRAIAERLPGVRVVVVAASDDPDHPQLAREAGAAAYVTKSRMATDLLDTILTVAGGGDFVAAT